MICGDILEKYIAAKDPDHACSLAMICGHMLPIESIVKCELTEAPKPEEGTC